MGGAILLARRVFAWLEADCKLEANNQPYFSLAPLKANFIVSLEFLQNRSERLSVASSITVAQ
jgi:hypothetical protein